MGILSNLCQIFPSSQPGATQAHDRAAMNGWLHRQVVNKLAAKGGKVPAASQD